MIFAIIVNIILFIIYFVISLIIPKRYNYIFRQYIVKMMMYMIGFKSIRTNNLDRVYKQFHSNDRVIIVSNHISLHDPSVCLASLGCICYVFHEDGIKGIPGLQTAVHSFSNSISKKKGSTVNMIKEYVDKRKSGEELLCIFADAMKKVPEGHVIAPFNTGAFVPRCKILPVVIKYKNYTIDPTYRWEDGDSLLWAYFRMFLDTTCDIVVDVMEPVEPDGMTIEEHRDCVYNKMEKRYKEL